MEKNESAEKRREMSGQSVEEMVRVGPGLCRKSLIMIAGGLLLGLLLLYYLQNYLSGLEDLAGEFPRQAVDRFLKVCRFVGVAIAIGFAAFGIYLFRISILTLRSGQFPPPGFRVIRDTRLLTGERATLRGKLGLIFAAVFVSFAFLLPWYMYRVVLSILEMSTKGNGV